MTHLNWLSILLFSTIALGNNCQIRDSRNNLRGVVAANGGKVARYDSTTKMHSMVALVTSGGLIHRVSNYNGDLIFFKTGRTSASGEVYDYRDAHLLGRVSNGNIYDALGNIVGRYSGCDDLSFGLRLSLVGAGAHQFLLFNPKFHAWDKVFFQYCRPIEMCRW